MPCRVQPDALACGRTAAELLAAEPSLDPALLPHRTFPGNRPSSSLLLPQLTAFSVGQLLSLYEHRTAVQASRRRMGRGVGVDVWGGARSLHAPGRTAVARWTLMTLELRICE